MTTRTARRWNGQHAQLSPIRKYVIRSTNRWNGVPQARFYLVDRRTYRMVVGGAGEAILVTA